MRRREGTGCHRHPCHPIEREVGVTRIGGPLRPVVVRSVRERGRDLRQGHAHHIRHPVAALARRRICAGGHPRLVAHWSVLSLRLADARTLRLRVVTVIVMNHHLRRDVTEASLRFVITAHPRAVMIVEKRGEDEKCLSHPSQPGVTLGHARGRLGPRCLSAQTTVGPVVEAIKKENMDYNILLLL